MGQLAVKSAIKSPSTGYEIDKIIYSNPVTKRAFYRVKNTSLFGTTYGLKVIEVEDGHQVRTIKNEVVALNRLPFGITSKCHLHWNQGNKHFLLMDWIEGTPLSEYLASNSESNIPLVQKLAIAEQVCKKVQQLHRFKLLHRDIKPDNIILQLAGRNVTNVYLIDFGSSTQKRETEEGTYHYRSPEQSIARNIRLTETSDIFSLSQVIHFILTGNPAELEPNFEISDWETEIDTQQNPALPKQIATVLSKGLRFSASRRTQQAQTIANQLRDASRRIK
ncbi:protein kinase [Endozoicomonas gorgoniicola]|uniref:Protein kinase n=1 Tax=Endozoicomonas gorgoniicola TaxID=1234144 RepID=A0ABT3MX46_9GAMM|nr:protein kinase [Endozoicomonas gorgoniicola]MCW7553955.1 protein kinase [Endozoicomonas gorgoniicola]